MESIGRSSPVIETQWISMILTANGDSLTNGMLLALITKFLNSKIPGIN